MRINELFEVSQDLVNQYKTAANKDVTTAFAAKAAGTIDRDEYERKMKKRGRGLAAAQRRLTPHGTRLDLTPYGDSIQKDYDRYRMDEQGVTEGRVVFFGTGANGSKYEIIQTSPTDFMIHADGKHIDTYSSLQRAMGVLRNEVPGLQQGVTEVSADTLTSYLTKVDADARKHKMDPTRRSAEKRSKSVAGFAKAFDKLDAKKQQGVAEGRAK